eukprot:976815-Rhodomonas_salina.2
MSGCLRARYAMPGTDLEYGATLRPGMGQVLLISGGWGSAGTSPLSTYALTMRCPPPIVLCAHFAMSRTDMSPDSRGEVASHKGHQGSPIALRLPYAVSGTNMVVW